MLMSRNDNTFAFVPPVQSQFMDPPSQDISPVDDLVIIDSQTGLRFKRSSGSRLQQNSAIETSTRPIGIQPVTTPPVLSLPAALPSTVHREASIERLGSFYALNLDSQTHITESSVQSSVELQDSLPAEHVPPSEYHNYIPRHFTAIQSMRQLLIWHILKQIKNQQEICVPILDSEAQEVQKLVIIEQKKLIQRLIDGQAHISWYARPEDSQIKSELEENPVNIANEKRLRSLDKAITLFKDELEDWNTCTDYVYGLHAATSNQMEAEQEQPMEMDIDQIDVDSLMDEVDEEQRNFLQKHYVSDSRRSYKDLTSNVSLGVTQLRQTLNTAHRFSTRTDQCVSQELARLARKVKEAGRMIPIEQDRRIPGIFDNSEEKRKQSEFENAANILKLLSRLPKKPKISG